MAKCRYCHKHIPDGVARCPHCYATLQQPTSPQGEAVSPFQARATRPKKPSERPAARPQPATIGRQPIGRIALFGCLGLILLLVLGFAILGITAPDKARSLLFGTPTPPPPTPRPSPTPSPTPRPTPQSNNYEGPRNSFGVSFPHYWVVIDFNNKDWEQIFRFQSLSYSWLATRLPEEIHAQEDRAGAIWAFDPRRFGNTQVRCRVDPALKGMSADKLLSSQGNALLDVAAELGGRNKGAIGSYKVEIDGRPAVLFEWTVMPTANSDLDRPIKLQYYALADEDRGYWIEIRGFEDDLDLDEPLIQGIVDSFDIGLRNQQND